MRGEKARGERGRQHEENRGDEGHVTRVAVQQSSAEFIQLLQPSTGSTHKPSMWDPLHNIDNDETVTPMASTLNYTLARSLNLRKSPFATLIVRDRVGHHKHGPVMQQQLLTICRKLQDIGLEIDISSWDTDPFDARFR